MVLRVTNVEEVAERVKETVSSWVTVEKKNRNAYKLGRVVEERGRTFRKKSSEGKESSVN